MSSATNSGKPVLRLWLIRNFLVVFKGYSRWAVECRSGRIAEKEKPSLPNEPMEESVSSQQEIGDRRELDESAFDETLLKVRPRPLPGQGRPRPQDAERSTVRVGGATGRTNNQNATDVDKAVDAEKWTVIFETSQNRFPLLVAALQGKGAYGCDCLSFATEDDRNAFREDPQKVSLVTRFIETKSGAVRFTKNEWNAAEKLGERYFAYRVSFSSGRRDKAVLTIVKNPRAQSSAIRVEHELLIDKVSSREEFDLFQSEQENGETQIKAS